MIVPYFSIRDAAADEFGIPQPDKNDQTAIRGFTYAINNPQNGTLNFTPKDYDLYKVGSFDTDLGKFVPLDLPVRIATGTGVYQKE